MTLPRRAAERSWIKVSSSSKAGVWVISVSYQPALTMALRVSTELPGSR